MFRLVLANIKGLNILEQETLPEPLWKVIWQLLKMPSTAYVLVVVWQLLML